MYKSDIRILLVEDDNKIGAAMAKVLEDSGYAVEWVRTPKEALQLAQRISLQVCLIDVMLPQKSGIDLLLEIQEFSNNEIKAFLMSGIYKDKNFVKDSLRKTNALEFLIKPFPIEKFLDSLDTLYKDEINPELNATDRILLDTDYNKRDLINALNETKQIHSLELPIFISKLLKHKVSGTIILTNKADSDASIIEISSAKVVSVKVKDPKSVFGQLLVEKGFLSHDELEKALAQPGNKRIGEKLIDASLISPHSIDIINAEQLAIRMSLLIGDSQYEFQFQEKESQDHLVGINEKMFNSFLGDWILSKYSYQWQSIYFSRFTDNSLQLHPKFDRKSPLLLHPIVVNCPRILDKISSGMSINELIASGAWPEEAILNAILFFLANDILFFKMEARSVDASAHLQRISKLVESSKKQDFFQILGITKNARNEDIRRAYKDLAKIFHPDKLSKTMGQDLIDATKEYFSIISKAHDTLSNTESKDTYLKELQHGQTKVRLKQEALFEESRELLRARKYPEALAQLNAACGLFEPNPEIRLHLMWAKMQNLTPENSADSLKEVHDNLNKIPPEDRHNAIYYFVKGLFQKNIGEVAGAIGNIQHAVSMEPSFVEAKRELNILKLEGDGKPVDFMHADLKDVVGLFFKKKKK